ncbi:MAG: tyrosine-type recombinase/integrase [Gammaproteobacteria bacterium]
MLNLHVTSPVTLAHLEATPCWPFLDGYTDWLEGRHYSSSLIQLYLFGIVPLGRWLKRSKRAPCDLDYCVLDAYRRHRASIGQWRYRNGKIKQAFHGAQRFHEYLVAIDVVAAPLDPALVLRPLHKQFEQWMRVHRGVREVTLRGYEIPISALLDCLGDDPARYTAALLRRFLLGTSSRAGIATVKATSTAVRAFLRFLVATEQCHSALLGAIPRIADWRLAALPTYLARTDVERLIASCEERPLTARRDRAVLLLLWRLALRAGDVANLELIDIDWREGRMKVTGKNRRDIWLPLSQDVGDAIVSYLQHERPAVDNAHVFLKCIAPAGPLNSRCVSSIVRRAIECTGIDAPASGAHLLRRSAATDMLLHGATLSQIGSVLRHESFETTQLYAKVDGDLLHEVAARWPSDPSSASRPSSPANDLTHAPTAQRGTVTC